METTMALPLKTSGSTDRKVAFAKTPVTQIKELRCVDGSIFIICGLRVNL